MPPFHPSPVITRQGSGTRGDRIKRSGRGLAPIERQRFTPDLTRALKDFKGHSHRCGPWLTPKRTCPPTPLMLLEAGPLAESALDQLQSFANEEVATPQATLPGDRRLLLQAGGDAYNSLGNALSALRDFLISGRRST